MDSRNILIGSSVIATGMAVFTHAIVSHGERPSVSMIEKYPATSFLSGLIGGYISLVGSDYTLFEKLFVSVSVGVCVVFVTPVIGMGYWDLTTNGTIDEYRKVVNDEQMDQLTFFEKIEFVEDSVDSTIVEVEN